MQNWDLDKLVQITQGGDSYLDARNHILAPQHYGGLGSFRWLVSGRSGRGKTLLVLNCILDGFIKFDHLYLFVRDTTQPKYQFLIKWLNTMENEFEKEIGKKVKMYTVESDPSKIPDVDKLNNKIVNVAIFDDMLMEKHQEKIVNYFVRGRHKNVSCIYITQSYHTTDIVIRKQCDYFAIFGVSSKTELEQISKSLSFMYDYKEFKEIFTKATEGANDFLFVDMRTDLPILRLRKGFDTYWDEERHEFLPLNSISPEFSLQ